MKVRVEYENRPIKHIAIQCPSCQSWFYGYDVTKHRLSVDYDIEYAECCCPKCNTKFCGGNGELEIEEVSYPEIYKGCLYKKTVWVNENTCDEDSHKMDYYCNAMDNRSNIDT